MAAAQRKAYTLVLLDMLMPEMDGVEAARSIRTGSLNAATPIIAVTANAFAEDHERCLSAGMDHVLTKPLQMAALQQVLARHTNLQSAWVDTPPPRK